MENKFKIGDVVDYVNDYGVLFKEHKIIDIEIETDIANQCSRNYYINKDSYWFPVKEEQLHIPGTYKMVNDEITLNNGFNASFNRYSDWDEKIYTIAIEDRAFNVLLVDNYFYSISDYEEAMVKIDYEFQPKVEY